MTNIISHGWALQLNIFIGGNDLFIQFAFVRVTGNGDMSSSAVARSVDTHDCRRP